MARCLILLLLVSLVSAAPEAPVAEKKARDPIVEKGLAYLATQQQPDGSFRFRSGAEPAATGLTMLAFLSAGVTPDDEKYGKLLTNAALYLVRSQDEKGLLGGRRFGSSTMYGHGMATWALAEYSGHKKKAPEVLRVAVERAVNLIVASQSARGGWRYEPIPRDEDMSITAWQAQALRAAVKVNHKVPDATFEKLAKFVDACHRKNRGFAYQGFSGTPPTPACTAWGTLELLQAGAKPDREDLVALREVILKEIDRPRMYPAYTLQAQAQALAQFDPKTTEKGFAQIAETVKKLAKPETGEIVGQGIDIQHGSVYSTSMAILTLTAQDRKLSIQQDPKP